MLSAVKDTKSRVMLAAQMATVQMASTTFDRDFAHVESTPQQGRAEMVSTKLVKTFTTQREALKRYWTVGQQKVTVGHVTVSEGGPATVGSIPHAPEGRVFTKSQRRSMSSLKSPLPMHFSSRCSARSKRTGERCRATAITGWIVCRFHRERGGGPKGERNGIFRHRRAPQEAIWERFALAALLSEACASLDSNSCEPVS